MFEAKAEICARVALAGLALAAPCAAQATDAVALSTNIFVERTTIERGRNRVVLQQPARVTSGDRLVFMLDYRNTATARGDRFIVTNPMPATVAFQGAADRSALVSIDGGRRWGTLAQLRVTERDGSVRGARPEDVTHVRWTLDRAAPAGKLMFRGVVR